MTTPYRLRPVPADANGFRNRYTPRWAMLDSEPLGRLYDGEALWRVTVDGGREGTSVYYVLTDRSIEAGGRWEKVEGLVREKYCGDWTFRTEMVRDWRTA